MLLDHLAEEAAAQDIEKGLTQIQGPPIAHLLPLGKERKKEG